MREQGALLSNTIAAYMESPEAALRVVVRVVTLAVVISFTRRAGLCRSYLGVHINTRVAVLITRPFGGGLVWPAGDAVLLGQFQVQLVRPVAVVPG